MPPPDALVGFDPPPLWPHTEHLRTVEHGHREPASCPPMILQYCCHGGAASFQPEEPLMPYEDKTITCVDCNQGFQHSADDQARYAERGFSHEPKRCRPCRESRRSQGSGDGGRQRESHEVTCAECGAQTTVPFKPTEDRPVYCRDCFRSRRS